MIDDKFSRRFQELHDAGHSLQYSRNQLGGSDRYVPHGQWEKWANSALSLIKAVFSEQSPQYRNFTRIYKECRGFEDTVKSMIGVFDSAKEDFDGGYVFNVQLMVSGEIFGDFVGIAKQALSEGHKDVAAVLACAALEDTLKRFGMSKGLEVEDKDMTTVVNALKSQGEVSGAEKSLLNAMPKIRDYAMHANWDKITETDVRSVISLVDQFLLSRFH